MIVGIKTLGDWHRVFRSRVKGGDKAERFDPLCIEGGGVLLAIGAQAGVERVGQAQFFGAGGCGAQQLAHLLAEGDAIVQRQAIKAALQMAHEREVGQGKRSIVVLTAVGECVGRAVQDEVQEIMAHVALVQKGALEGADDEGLAESLAPGGQAGREVQPPGGDKTVHEGFEIIGVVGQLQVFGKLREHARRMGANIGDDPQFRVQRGEVARYGAGHLARVDKLEEFGREDRDIPIGFGQALGDAIPARRVQRRAVAKRPGQRAMHALTGGEQSQPLRRAIAARQHGLQDR